MGAADNNTTGGNDMSKPAKFGMWGVFVPVIKKKCSEHKCGSPSEINAFMVHEHHAQ